MVYLLVNGMSYGLAFRHARVRSDAARKRGKKPAAVSAVTTCVLVAPALVAIENAFCVDTDNFSRPVGRRLAFAKILTRCLPLKAVAGELLKAFDQRWPALPPSSRSSNGPRKLPPDEVERRREAGAAVREAREKAQRTQAADASASLETLGRLSRSSGS